MKVALITGITGQDGSYLAEELLANGWTVYGIMRRASVFTTERIEHIWSHSSLRIRHGDLTDIAGLTNVLAEIKALKNVNVFHIYNLAAQSHVGVSFETPLYTAHVDAIGVLNLLEAVRSVGLSDIARIYQASTSELYGKVVETPQNELTPFYPRSPYGVAKLYAYWIAKNYREAYGMHICNGISHNHESERRGKTFVTRKITIGLSKIYRVLRASSHYMSDSDFADQFKRVQLVLGNLEAQRDWGHARDYVQGMISILNYEGQPDDYVLATGVCHSVREFVETAFKYIGINIQWQGTGLDEVGIATVIRNSGPVTIELIRIDSNYFRPAEVDLLMGDASKAKRVLGWEPKITFEQLVKMMVEHDCPNLNENDSGVVTGCREVENF